MPRVLKPTVKDADSDFTYRQSKAADAIGAGYTIERAAMIAGAPSRTVAEWMGRSDFAGLIAEYRQRVVLAQEPRFLAGIDMAQELILDALRGEIAADSPRVLLAERYLSRTLWRAITAVVGGRANLAAIREEPKGLPYADGTFSR